MFKYTINIKKELSEHGISATLIKQRKIFGQSTMQKFLNGDTTITLESLNRLCYITGKQPGEILEFTVTDEDEEKYKEFSSFIVNKEENDLGETELS